MGKTILVIAAHPDDEVIGCGGTIGRFTAEGAKVFSVILGEGIASRAPSKVTSADIKRGIEALKKDAMAANKIMGVKKVFFFDFPDNRFDTIALLDIVKAIEGVKKAIKPDVIFTHFSGDLNVDHQIAYKAAITASRPLASETVKEAYSFEVMSSTEWGYPLSFSPDTFFDITKTLRTKLKAMNIYKTELCASSHPRSLEGLELNARLRGMQVGLRYAEAFKVVRIIK